MFLVTFSFLLFMGITLGVYYLVPKKYQWVVLLIASAVFYILAGEPKTVFYLLITTITVWAAGVFIETVRDNAPGKARSALIFTLVLNISILAVLKYTNFFLNNIQRVFGNFGSSDGRVLVHWVASLGVSFYTLQAIGYLLDVYWGTSKAQRSFLKFTLFVSYFPQMSSGPISRYHQLGMQLYESHSFHYQNICFGLQRMMFGFVKKLVLAENLGIYLNVIFDDNANYNGLFIWIGMIGYLLQLYADFSGCMDIVLGASECFGITMPENFDRPFHSRSIQEFWKRWHITLGSWVQDYIMFPILHSKLWGKMRKDLKKRLGKKAAKNIPTYLAMLILWLFMGLWHGGEWRYVVEMIWFWFVIMLGQLLERKLDGISAYFHINKESNWWHRFQSIRTTLVFGIGVVFFRATSVQRALHYLKSAFSPKCLSLDNFLNQLMVYKATKSEIEWIQPVVCIGAGLLVMLILTVFTAAEKDFRVWLSERNLIIRWTILYLILFIIILFGVYGPGFNASEFIYGGF